MVTAAAWTAAGPSRRPRACRHTCASRLEGTDRFFRTVHAVWRRPRPSPNWPWPVRRAGRRRERTGIAATAALLGPAMRRPLGRWSTRQRGVRGSSGRSDPDGVDVGRVDGGDPVVAHHQKDTERREVSDEGGNEDSGPRRRRTADAPTTVLPSAAPSTVTDPAGRRPDGWQQGPGREPAELFETTAARPYRGDTAGRFGTCREKTPASANSDQASVSSRPSPSSAARRRSRGKRPAQRLRIPSARAPRPRRARSPWLSNPSEGRGSARR